MSEKKLFILFPILCLFSVKAKKENISLNDKNIIFYGKSFSFVFYCQAEEYEKSLTDYQINMLKRNLR